MSVSNRQEELARRGLIAEKREALGRLESRISGAVDMVRVATSTLMGFDSLDADQVREAAEVLAEAIEARQRLLAEIKQLEEF